MQAMLCRDDIGVDGNEQPSGRLNFQVDQRAMGQNRVVLRHFSIHIPMSEGTSKRTNEHSGAREQSAEQ